jgi:ribosome recycling factor
MIRGLRVQFSRLAGHVLKTSIQGLPRVSFATKVSKKDQKRQEFLKEKSNTEVPSEVDLAPYDLNCKALVQDFEKDLQNIKIGKLTPQSFNNIFVSSNHEATPIHQLGQVIPINATSISITPFDSKMTQPIITALQKDKLNDFSVVIENERLIVNVPAGNTKEKKVKLLKMVKEAFDKFKDALRQIRTKEMKSSEKMAKFIAKEQGKLITDEIERIYEKNLKNLEDVCKKKEKEFN